MKELKRDFKSTMGRGEIDRIVEEAREHGFHLRMEESALILNEMLREKMRFLQKAKGSELLGQAEWVEEIITLLDLVERWGFELSKEEGQNIMDEIMDECIEGVEKCWWGNGTERPFPPNLIALAEKLGFNVERFSKMVSPTASMGRS
jgi:hypothetical protein